MEKLNYSSLDIDQKSGCYSGKSELTGSIPPRIVQPIAVVPIPSVKNKSAFTPHQAFKSKFDRINSGIQTES